MRDAGALVIAVLLIVLTTVAGGCESHREFRLIGQVLDVNETSQEITIKHGDIVGFMPGMTMAFKVRNAALLKGRTRGDLVTATLVVKDSGAYIATLEHTGEAAVADGPLTLPATPLEPGQEVPNVTFTDEAGTKRALSDWRGQTLAVTFIYTRCPLPDFCPRMNRHFGAVQHGVLADARLRERVHLISVTFDPDVDTPAVLAEHARQYGANPMVWSFLTGDRASIERFASQFGVLTVREGETPTEIGHNLKTAVIDTDGRLLKVFSGNEWTPDELLAAVRGAR